MDVIFLHVHTHRGPRFSLIQSSTMSHHPRSLRMTWKLVLGWLFQTDIALRCYSASGSASGAAGKHAHFFMFLFNTQQLSLLFWLMHSFSQSHSNTLSLSGSHTPCLSVTQQHTFWPTHSFWPSAIQQHSWLALSQS